MSKTFFELMDDMHLSSQSIFYDFYKAVETGNIALAQSLLDDNPQIKNQITNSENINYIINVINERELEPKEDIDYFLDNLYNLLITNINNTIIMGDYDNNTQYKKFNCVYYQDKLYFAINEPPIGTLPTNTEYWIEYDIKGYQGYGGITNLNYKGSWDSGTDYVAGDLVVYRNKLWAAIAPNNNYSPNLNHYPWSLIMVPAPAVKTPIQKETPTGYSTGDLWFQITEGEDIIQSSWKILTPSPTGRFASASFLIDNVIYVVAGQDASIATTNKNEAFDIKTKTWSVKANYPENADGMYSFVINDIGYCSAGINSMLQPIQSTYAYDPSTNSWTKKADLPVAQFAINNGFSYNDKGYVVGGLASLQQVINNLYEYDPTADSWSIKTTIPDNKVSSACAMVGSKLYLIGGADIAENIYSATRIYDFSTNTWSTGKDIPNARAYCATFSNGSSIYVIGGFDSLLYSTNIVEVYNTETNEWTEEIPMNYPRNSLCAENTITKGYAIGGINITKPDVSGYTEEYSFVTEDSSFEMLVDTSLGTNTIKIPMAEKGTYKYYIDWGDGETSSFITAYNDNNATHTYKTAGEYTVKLIGTLDYIPFSEDQNTAICIKEILKCQLNLIDISGMFSGCSNLNLIVSDIFTQSPNVTSAFETFKGCSSLSIIPETLFSNNYNITTFENCFLNAGLTSIPSGLFNGNGKAVNFNSTFEGTQIVSIPLSLFSNNSLITSINKLFYNCNNLTYVPNGMFANLPYVTSYNSVFSGENLETIPADLFGTNTITATSFDSMFISCPKITSLPSGLFQNAVAATSYNNIFSQSPITIVPENFFNGVNATWENSFLTGNITDLKDNSLNGLLITSDMFQNKTSLVNVGNDVFWKNNIDVPIEPTNLFNGCSNLVSIGNINLNNLADTVDLNTMFAGCTKLTDISGFKNNYQPSLANNISFEDCPLTHDSLINISNSLKMLTEANKKTIVLGDSNLSKLSDIEKLSILSKNWNLQGYTVNMTLELAKELVNYLYGNDFTNTALEQETSLYFYIRLYDPSTTETLGYYAVDKSTGATYNYDEVPITEYYILADYDTGSEEDTTQEYWVSKTEDNDTSLTVLKNKMKELNSAGTLIGLYIGKENQLVRDTGLNNAEDLYRLFQDFTNLTQVVIYDSENCQATRTWEMFDGCTNITSIDISRLNISYAEDMSDMFYNCQKLTNLNLGNFNNSKVTDMSYMFYNCKVLPNINISNFNTSKVTDMSYMFNGCKKLTSLDLSNFNTENVTSMRNLFYDCESLTDLDLSNFNTSNVTIMEHMFNGCSGLTSLDLSNFNTSKVTDMSYMFRSCSRLSNLNITNFDVSHVKFMISMFAGCTQLRELNLDNFDMSSIVWCDQMFRACMVLTSTIVLRKAPESYDSMFQSCSIYGNSKFTVNYIEGLQEAAQNIVNTKDEDGNVVLGTVVQ